MSSDSTAPDPRPAAATGTGQPADDPHMTIAPGATVGMAGRDTPRPGDLPRETGVPGDPYLKLANVGRCTVTSHLGKGGMGAVYKGRHRDLDIDVAVKFLHAHLTQEPGS